MSYDTAMQGDFLNSIRDNFIYNFLTNVILTYVGISLLTLIIGIIFIIQMKKLTLKLLKKSKMDPALHNFIASSVKIILSIILVIIIMAELNIPTAPVITVLGASGAAIALALRDSLANVAGGIIIMITKPILKGEVIEIEGTIGAVDSIELLATHLHTMDNKKVTIPNGKLTNSIVTNYSREDIRRVDCQFGISSEADLVKAKELLKNVALSCSLILEKPNFVVGVDRHGEEGTILDLKLWAKTEDYFDVKYFVEENVKLAFDEAGISPAAHIVDVRLKK
ncbi:MAG: mechanosensitive ion channel family protein [Peptostreptococcaceae bacterium]|nr:mechanosensitive ion channel family protein [Peptostreptococcaceae bacterium]MDY5739718.1 mechanosensitive ion channel family protein [Anaerovoracaceae bacterium]